MLSDEQKALRRTGVGASEAAAVLGLPAFLSPLDIWLDKVEGVERPDTADLRRGRVLESAVAQLYEAETGAALSECGTIRCARSSVLLATPDRMARTDALGEYPLELKTVRGAMRHRYGESGTDEVPPQYLVQVAVQMACTGCEVAELAALIGGEELRIYKFTRDIELAAGIIEGVERWWRDYVVTRTPPPVDGSTAWAERLASLPRRGVVVAATQEMREAAERLREAKRLAKHADRLERTARSRLLELMGDAEGVDGLATYREHKGRQTTDWRALCFEARVAPELVERFTTRSPYRVLRLLGGDNE